MRVSTSLALVLFFVATIVLVATLPNLYLVAQHSTAQSHRLIADTCATDLADADLSNPEAARQRMDELRRRYGLRFIRIDRSAAAPPSGERIEVRRVGGLTLLIGFSDSLESARRLLRIAGAAGAVATGCGLILLAVGIAAVLRSGGTQGARSVESAAGASGMSYEVFATSIRTLKGRESELQRLHDQEKERAGELAMLTATLVRSMASGLIAIDEQGRLVDINQAGRELLNISPTLRVTGSTVAEALGDSVFARRLAEAVHSQTTLQRLEIEELSRDQTIGLTTVSLLDESGRYFGMLALFSDLTLMRKLERRVRDMQSLADLGEMSAGIAHEFRNSLSTILGYLRLTMKTTLARDTRERLQRAEDEANQLAAAVESLLAFARPMLPERRPVDLRKLASEITDRLSIMSQRTHFILSGPSALVIADPALLERAVENVVRNAIDAIEEKGGDSGTIEIDVSSMPYPSITIRDDGVGVDAASVTRLFLPFQSTKPQGFGLGLALARKIVLLHGGTITLTGERGSGATARIEFPAELACTKPTDVTA